MLGDDNPITIDTRLSLEVERLGDAGVVEAALARIEETAIDHAFCEPSVRASLRSGVAP